MGASAADIFPIGRHFDPHRISMRCLQCSTRRHRQRVWKGSGQSSYPAFILWI